MDINRLRELAGQSAVREDDNSPEAVQAKVEAVKEMIDELDGAIQSLAPHLMLNDDEVYEIHNWLQNLADDFDSI